MSKKLMFLMLFSASMAQAQYGRTIYQDFRQEREQQAPSYHDNTGNMYRQIGNTTYSQSGTNYTRSGNQIFGTDGSIYEISGQSIYKDGKEICRVFDHSLECEDIKKNINGI